MTIQRYCIGCKHLKFRKPVIGHGSEYTGDWTIEDASLACGLGLWRAFLNEYDKLFDLEKAMETAQSCVLFEERT